LGLTIADLWDWQSQHLEWILEAIGDLMRAGGWSVAVFKANMGIANGGTIDLIRGGTHPDGYYAEVSRSVLGLTNQAITFYDSAFATKGLAKYVTVHEFAHVWDNAQGGSLSGGMQRATKSSGIFYDYPDGTCPLGPLCYNPNGSPVSDYATASADEDWAETVTSLVYPSFPTFSGGDSTRRNYARSKLGTPSPPASKRGAQ
jgi:hypothetical protein